jgi:hypothetical protein
MSRLHDLIKKAARLKKDIETLGETCRSKDEEENDHQEDGEAEDNGSTGNR